MRCDGKRKNSYVDGYYEQKQKRARNDRNPFEYGEKLKALVPKPRPPTYPPPTHVLAQARRDSRAHESTATSLTKAHMRRSMQAEAQHENQWTSTHDLLETRKQLKAQICSLRFKLQRAMKKESDEREICMKNIVAKARKAYKEKLQREIKKESDEREARMKNIVAEARTAYEEKLQRAPRQPFVGWMNSENIKTRWGVKIANTISTNSLTHPRRWNYEAEKEYLSNDETSRLYYQTNPDENNVCAQCLPHEESSRRLSKGSLGIQRRKQY